MGGPQVPVREPNHQLQALLRRRRHGGAAGRAACRVRRSPYGWLRRTPARRWLRYVLGCVPPARPVLPPAPALVRRPVRASPGLWRPLPPSPLSRTRPPPRLRSRATPWRAASRGRAWRLRRLRSAGRRAELCHVSAARARPRCAGGAGPRWSGDQGDDGAERGTHQGFAEGRLRPRDNQPHHLHHRHAERRLVRAPARLRQNPTGVEPDAASARAQAIAAGRRKFCGV
mmetsp:Transcript_41945/g.84377  ORF Transcript_41945/g.84377 Transcript_41945/m.84377 type:complete len:229 (-) Transcript_41945:330-1016(-)